MGEDLPLCNLFEKGLQIEVCYATFIYQLIIDPRPVCVCARYSSALKTLSL